jgi:lipopolysaccharide/colanic/teichoic acid biosynthesis glycosyltransferase
MKLKIFFDITVSLIIILLCVFPLAILSLLIFLRLGRPILFRQLRPGLNGKLFKLVKFRTMTSDRNENGDLLPDSERLTRFGAFLRSTSLDELPTLWNVIRCNMSLVGPRPLLVEYLDLYSYEQAKRHNVRPGITGWAQINGRNALSWNEKFILDTWYVNHKSFWLDIKILFLTVRQVVKRHGINADGDLTMPKFLGSDNV